MSEPTIEDIQAILEQFDRSDWDELRIESHNFELHVFKTPDKRRQARSAVPSPTPQHPAMAPAAATSMLPPAAAAAPQSDAESDAEPDADRSGLVVVRAPTLGTFYRAPKPGAAPFVSIGAQVEPSTEVCIIEVMKLFTSVQAGVSGTVREVLVADAELVEYDQPLIVIEPAGS